MGSAAACPTRGSGRVRRPPPYRVGGMAATSPRGGHRLSRRQRWVSFRAEATTHLSAQATAGVGASGGCLLHWQPRKRPPMMAAMQVVGWPHPTKMSKEHSRDPL
ncbi:hypothetical protein B296_00026192 [Ensete ventricosum]|uniref:Uncharacterized protein n=1 Tax=Ensete ventricosum TaxID=4639 RepID=A0A427AS27_ENSVE|nr:hypothetical protein B296_00026192 [Ensete ventricosum]